jgi:thiazole/oxazole-forming peptide maturase SagD family component
MTGLTFYPYSAHLSENVLRSICSQHTGITQSLLASPISYSQGLRIKSVATNMPYYHKVLLNPNLDMQYHLSGYGMFYEEALIRLVGEAIERYSLMISHYTLGDRLQYATYSEISKTGDAIPLDYLRLFSAADYAKLNRGDYKSMKRLEPDDVIGWVKCSSLFDPDRDVWAPAQMLFVGYRFNAERKEVAFSPAFSTGTAAHMSVDKALQNALLEAIEIDALMVHWYTGRKAPAIIINDLTVQTLFPELFAMNSQYELLAIDLRMSERAASHAVAVVLINKARERPLIVLGAQSGLEPKQTLYRALMEAVGVAFLGIYGPLYLPKQYLESHSEEVYTDLDRNVSFFAEPSQADAKIAAVRQLVSGTKLLSSMPNYQKTGTKGDTARLIEQLSELSQYAVFLDITPPETHRMGWHVMRVFVPELVTMCVPGVPYSEHRRMKEFGGVRNEYPHPLP